MILTEMIGEAIDNIASDVVIASGNIGGPVGSAIQDAALNVFLRKQGGTEMAEITKDMLGLEGIGSEFEKLAKRSENNSQIAEFVKGLDYEHIGPGVVVGSFSENMLTNVTAICRRRFKKKDVIAFVDVSEEDEYDSGIIFTESGIVSWNNSGKDIYDVEYSAISEVDYDETNVYIKSTNSMMEINLGEYADEEKYPRYMYTFIMDIVDYVNGEYDEDVFLSIDENEEEE